MGFAGALAEIGIAQTEVPLALLMFDVGVEAGQVMFVVALSLLIVGLRYIQSYSAEMLFRVAPYAIGTLAAFWTFERTDTFI